MTKNLWESTVQFVQRTDWWGLADFILYMGAVLLAIMVGVWVFLYMAYLGCEAIDGMRGAPSGTLWDRML